MTIRFVVLISVMATAVTLTPVLANAWGRRGHSIVCQTAAAVLAANTPDRKPDRKPDRETDYLKKHSLDLGFYCNVPDLVWKKPATYKTEHPQHFMDLEIFTRAFKSAGVKSTDEFQLSRLEFEKKYPSITSDAGRSYWRISEFADRLTAEAQSLKSAPIAPDTTDEARAKHQENWLVTAGALGHYVGDLSQPLHTTENYDGVLTNQKGIHAFFEDTVVDELSSSQRPASLEAAVGAEAMRAWLTYHKKAQALSVLQISESLGDSSTQTLPTLLALDKKTGRNDLKHAAVVYEPMIRERLVAAALALAEIWSRSLDWPYDGKRFFNFNGAPDYVEPPAVKTSPASAH